MSRTNATMINSVKGTSTLVRARFGPGMLLQHDDLEQLNAYTRNLSRLLFRAFFGCGVVCGLKVAYTRVCGKPGITVAPGLALDCSGDPVYVPKAQSLPLAGDCENDIPSPLWVLLCGTTKCCSPRTPVCASDDDEPSSVCTRERDGFELRVTSVRPDCACGRRDREERDPERECACDPGEECDCDCIILAQLQSVSAAAGEEGRWIVDHSVRRFIRPVLMSDPCVTDRRTATTPLQVSEGDTHSAATQAPLTPGPVRPAAVSQPPAQTAAAPVGAAAAPADAGTAGAAPADAGTTSASDAGTAAAAGTAEPADTAPSPESVDPVDTSGASTGRRPRRTGR